MHKLEAVIENEMHRILWDFEIQIDHSNLTRKPDLVFIKKKKRTCYLVDFSVLADYRMI